MAIGMFTPPGGVYDDVLLDTSLELGTRGLIDPANGTTRPLPGVRSPEEIMGIINGWFTERRAQQGGAAMDEAHAPRDASYADRRFRVLEQFEGTRTQVYRDNVGLRTVGIGFNMEQSGARAMWASAGLSPERFDTVRDGRERLSDPEVRQLADLTMDRAESIVNSRMAGVDLTEGQRLALVSMAFNAPALIGPKITAAMREGNLTAAVHEVLYNSGTANNPALARRRYHEATMLVGEMDAQRYLPNYNAYRANPSAPSQVAQN